MDFRKHSDLEGKHAFLSASNYHWINYTEEKLFNRYNTYSAAVRGTELHELAHRAIKLGVKLPRSPKTLNMYVNDAIGYRMKTEVVLYYSENCFGTADAISFRRNELRIHDLKTGFHTASIKQLVVYAALFCLEYNFRPGDIEVELRIYQNDDVMIELPDVDEIAHVMDKIVSFDKIVSRIRLEEDR